MTAAKAIEYQITRQLLQRQQGVATGSDFNLWVDRLIAILATTAGLFLLGSYLEELLWAVLAAGTIVTLGADI
jgi:hypothetical protein